jgi:hypothetical protein
MLPVSLCFSLRLFVPYVRKTQRNWQHRVQKDEEKHRETGNIGYKKTKNKTPNKQHNMCWITLKVCLAGFSLEVR